MSRSKRNCFEYEDEAKVLCANTGPNTCQLDKKRQFRQWCCRLGFPPQMRTGWSVNTRIMCVAARICKNSFKKGNKRGRNAGKKKELEGRIDGINKQMKRRRERKKKRRLKKRRDWEGENKEKIDARRKVQRGNELEHKREKTRGRERETERGRETQTNKQTDPHYSQSQRTLRNNPYYQMH